MQVHRAAGLALVELRHEGDGQALLDGDLLRQLFVDHVAVRHLEKSLYRRLISCWPGPHSPLVIFTGTPEAKRCPADGEWGPGQHEINVRFSDFLKMADRHVIYNKLRRRWRYNRHWPSPSWRSWTRALRWQFDAPAFKPVVGGPENIAVRGQQRPRRRLTGDPARLTSAGGSAA